MPRVSRMVKPEEETLAKATTEEQTAIAEVPTEETSVTIKKPIKRSGGDSLIPASFRVLTRTAEDRVPYLNILAHGESGSGKTTFGGTMISSGLKTFYIAFREDEMETLDSRGITGYDYHIVRQYKELPDIYFFLRKNANQYEGVVLDGLGDLQQGAKDVSRAGGIDSVNSVFIRNSMLGASQMEIRNWGEMGEIMRSFLSNFLLLPLHKIVTCISDTADDPITGKPQVYPALQGALRQIIKAPFGVVGYSYIAHYGEQDLMCMATQMHESIKTKDRTGLCRVLVDPTFEVFYRAWEGEIPPKSKMQDNLERGLIVQPKARPKITPKEEKKK